MNHIGRGIASIGIATDVGAMAYYGKEWGCFWGMWFGTIAIYNVWGNA